MMMFRVALLLTLVFGLLAAGSQAPRPIGASAKSNASKVRARKIPKPRAKVGKISKPSSRYQPVHAKRTAKPPVRRGN